MEHSEQQPLVSQGNAARRQSAIRLFNSPESLGQYMTYLENQEKSALSLVVVSIVCNLVFIVAIVCVLVTDDSNCEPPVRLWLLVAGITFGVGILTALYLQLAFSNFGFMRNALFSGCLVVLIGLYFMFSFVWFIIGNIWLYSDNDCLDDFTWGYTVTLVILIFYYIVIGLLFCFCCCCVCCVHYIGNLFLTQEQA